MPGSSVGCSPRQAAHLVNHLLWHRSPRQAPYPTWQGHRSQGVEGGPAEQRTHGQPPVDTHTRTHSRRHTHSHHAQHVHVHVHGQVHAHRVRSSNQCGLVAVRCTQCPGIDVKATRNLAPRLHDSCHMHVYLSRKHDHNKFSLEIASIDITFGDRQFTPAKM